MLPKMAFYALIFLAGFVIISLWSLWLAIRPPRILIGAKPADYKLPAEEVSIETADGLKLSAWFIPAAAPAITDFDGRQNLQSGVAAIVLLHGYPAEKSDLLPIAAALHPHFPILLLDLRYFGQSQGSFTTLGLKERDDLKRAVDFLERRGFTEAGVFGFSLGGAIGIMSAADDPRIRAVAAYAPFADLRTLGYETYGRLWLLKYPLVELMALWARLLLGGDVTRPSPSEIASKLSIPVFLIASREDEQIPFRHAEILQGALSQNQKAAFYFQERGRHGELPPDFEERIIEFFQKHL